MPEEEYLRIGPMACMKSSPPGPINLQKGRQSICQARGSSSLIYLTLACRNRITAAATASPAWASPSRPGTGSIIIIIARGVCSYPLSQVVSDTPDVLGG